jgi:hypothetical protein
MFFCVSICNAGSCLGDSHLHLHANRLPSVKIRADIFSPVFIILLPHPAQVSGLIRVILRRRITGRLFDDKWDSQHELRWRFDLVEFNEMFQPAENRVWIDRLPPARSNDKTRCR